MNNSRGITLIEMVAVIVVLGMAIPTLLTAFSSAAWRSSRSENIADATFYAQELMEEVKSKGFDENITPPWTKTLGPDSGETYPNFDDIDDFNGYSDTPAAGFTRSVAVDFVRLSGSTWGSCTFSGNCVAATTCTSCNECCYKRIQVTVSNNVTGNVTLVSVVTG